MQKTVISDLSNSILIEYITHFEPEAVLTLHPDKDFNGVFDAAERKGYLKRVHQLLYPNISCTIGTRILEFEETDRQLSLEDAGDFKNGVNTKFVWRVSLIKEGHPLTGLLRIIDNNFKAGEMNQLSYVVNVLGKNGPMALEGEGRELVLDLSAKYRALPDSEEVLPASLQEAPESGLSAVGESKSEPETDSLIAFLKNGSGGVKLYLVGFLTAFVLGALHALSPGHGKAMVAAYLVGTRGRVVDAVRLGAVVTVTHVISVIILGFVALVLSHYTLSQDFYPWLGVASGVLIFLTGYFLLARTALVSSGHSHHNHHDHEHGHDDSHGHSHSHTILKKGHHDGSENSHSLKEIISLGVAGGLVPCPSAIVILLFAVAVNRIVAGLMLILSFSLGLAAVLILIGVLTVTASNRLERLGSSVGWIKRLPIFTAGIIMVLGVAIGLNSLYQAGILVLNI
ncbi:MAG: high-affinity nickel-transporter [Desulfobulbaceae bacterium]|nr:high-affinity nickel-transporter [Desulfobulbaceae bacterium]